MRILLSGLVSSLILLTGCAGASSGSDSGSADPARSDAASAPASRQAPEVGAPTVVGYSFKPGTIEVNQADIVSRMDGVLALPADLSSGPKPVVFLIHGSYPGCVWPKKETLVDVKDANKLRWPDYCGTFKGVNDHGMTSGPVYLRHTAAMTVYADRLARAGIITVALDVQAKESARGLGNNPNEIQRLLVEAHARLMQDINSGNFHGLSLPAEAKGAFDFTRVGAIGHSSGGGFVTSWMTKPVPGLDLKAAVGFEPALNSGAPKKIAGPVTTLWFGGGCDEQAGPAGVRRDARDLAKANPGTTIWAEQAGTTHLAIIGGGDSTVGPVAPVKTKACAKANQATPEQARVAAAAVIAQFFKTAFASGTTYDLPSTKPTTITARVLGGSGVKVKASSIPAKSLGVDILAKTIRYQSVDEQLLTELTEPITPEVGGGGTGSPDGEYGG